MTIAYRNTGTPVAASAASHTVTVPSQQDVGDMMLLAYGTKPYTDVPTMIAGWTEIGVATDGTVSDGIDVGSIRMSYWWREATLATEPDVVITNTTNSVSFGVMMVFSKTATSWETPVGVGGGHGTAGTAVDITAGSNPGIVAGDFLAVGMVFRSDAVSAVSSQSITATDATIDTFTETPSEFVSTLGGDGAITGGYSSCTAGTASAAPHFICTLNTSHTGTMSMVRLREAAEAAPARPVQRVYGQGIQTASTW